ncbi:translocation/assembly module TamB domain-containing protein [Eikenella sp. Marseille-P7795]|uniref:translocation/assembly module TamB domain-containing protein n=1 Tax=Eikenella sp. Marseille-P7795 TaxID=2866577 RepID=UPI001CE41FE4|nr:translocation/assembly module TamB domain-containing protein [Eikenella sp. Marseille-P7795]
MNDTALPIDSHELPPQAEDPAAGSAPPPKRRRRWLRRLLAAFLLLLTLLLLSVLWLAGTESGLRFGVTQIPSWFGVDIRVKTLRGTLWRGFQGEEIQVASEGADVDISSISLQWQPKELWQRRLHVNRLAAGDIRIISKPTPPKEDRPPMRLPESVDLPLAVQLDRLEVGRISLGQKGDAVVESAALAYTFDHQSHKLNLTSLRVPWHEFQGSLSLDTASPFKLGGQILGSGELDGTAADSAFAVNGSLQEPDLQAQLDSGDIHFGLTGRLRPFEPLLNRKIAHLNIEGRQINPALFEASLPAADLVFNLALNPAEQADTLDGQLELRNHAPAPINADGIPVAALKGKLTVDTGGKLHLEDMATELAAGGRLTFNGNIDSATQNMAVDAAVQQFKLQDILKQQLALSLDGNIKLSGSLGSPQADWQLKAGQTGTSGTFQLLTDKTNRQRTLSLREVKISPASGGELQGEAALELFQERKLSAHIRTERFNPAAVLAELPQGSINGSVELDGTLASSPSLQLLLDWQHSHLSGAPLSGRADLRYEQEHLPKANVNLLLGRNRIRADGSFGKAGDRLNLDIDAPNLNLFGFGLTGYLKAQGFLAGEPAKLTADLHGHADSLAVQNAVRIARLDFDLKGSPDLSQPLNIKLDGRQIHIGSTQIDSLNLSANGSGKSHSINGSSSLSLSGKPFRLNLAANGGLNDEQQWNGRIGQLDIGGAFNLKLLNPIQLEAGAKRVRLDNARWAAMGGSLNLQNFVWEKQTGISSKGSADRLHLQELDNLLGLARNDKTVQFPLVIAGDWDLRYSRDAQGYLKLSQQSGDIVIPYRQQSLGLDKLVLDTRFHSGRIDNRLTGKTRYGTLDASVAVSQQFGNAISQAPISGYLKLNIPDLDAIRNLLPGGMSAKGELAVDTTVSGSVGEPRLNGTATGKNLYYRDRNTGVILDNGSLTSRFQGRDWLVDSLKFTRKDGNVELKGRVNLTGTTPDVDVSAQFARYPILDTPNRKLTLSGGSRLLYNPGRGMALTGELKVDSGHFGFQKSSMPGLDDDVVVLGEEKPAAAGATTPVEMDLSLDLNDSFRFSGQGLDVLLGGKLHLSARPKENVRAVGTVNIVRGQYKAYGQDLVIDKGQISFVGPLASPNLNLRATRKYSPVGAGVEVLGSLDNPRVSLVASEPMSDKDKLSWLILGRASSGNESDEAAVAAAAGAFLAGNINDKIGLLDDFGMTTRRTRNTQTGELNPAEQVITFGKRITNELYLGYEYSITSANQAVKLIWQINSTLQAISRVGTDSVSGEVRYSIRFD